MSAPQTYVLNPRGEGSETRFIVDRLARFPSAAVARMAGCSVAKVNAVRDLAQVVDMRAITAPVVAEPLPLPPPPQPPEWRPSLPPRARRVVMDVAERHGCTLADLLIRTTRRGPNDLSAIRQEAWSLLRAIRGDDGEPLYTLPRIGAWFGGKDHTTILYGIRRHEARRDGLPPPHKPYNRAQRAIYRASLRARKAADLAELRARVAWREGGRI